MEGGTPKLMLKIVHEDGTVWDKEEMADLVNSDLKCDKGIFFGLTEDGNVIVMDSYGSYREIISPDVKYRLDFSTSYDGMVADV